MLGPLVLFQAFYRLLLDAHPERLATPRFVAVSAAAGSIAMVPKFAPPTPAPTRGALLAYSVVPANRVTSLNEPTSTKARPLRPKSAEMGSGKRSSVVCV